MFKISLILSFTFTMVITPLDVLRSGKLSLHNDKTYADFSVDLSFIANLLTNFISLTSLHYGFV